MQQWETGFAMVRNNNWYDIKSFVQPDDPLVKEIASILLRTKNPIRAAGEFVHQHVAYGDEENEFWKYPWETLADRVGDCDDTAIALTSILRNYLPADKVYVAVGYLDGEGHAWVVANDRILESTAAPNCVIKHEYTPVMWRFPRRCCASSEQVCY
jgi:hypothetical protein